MSAICPECHSTVQPGYRGACVTCLRREVARRHSPGDLALEACRLLTEWAAGKTDLPDGLDVVVGAAEDALAGMEP